MMSDSNRSITLEGVEARTAGVEMGGTFVQFEGDEVPRGFRSSKLASVFPMTAVWSRFTTADAQTFIQMLKDAHRSSDARFLLEHGDKYGEYITASSIVEIHGYVVEVRKPSGITAVSFEAVEVA